MKSNKNILSDMNLNECTSCQFCESICPVNAITFSLNDEGFYRPSVSNACIECGLCQIHCYKFQYTLVNEDSSDGIECYSAKSKNKSILNSSASGGVSTVLFQKLLDEDYKIVGVTYNHKENIAETVVIENKEDLEILKGSKYMQTKNKNVFKEMINTNSKFAIIGTPCSIYPISSWAKMMKQDDRFFFIDFFCHGTPSMLLWKSYCHSIIKDQNIQSIKFRSKHYGWHEFCHEFVIQDKTIYSNITEKDPFFTMFFDNHFLNISCYGCKCRDIFEYCDIRLGDYWGAKYDQDVEGVSTVLLITKRAKSLFTKVEDRLEIEEEKFNDIVKEQAYKKMYFYDEDIRKLYLNKLSESLDINEIYKCYISNYSVVRKIKRIVKIFTKKLPTSLVMKIREIYHRK